MGKETKKPAEAATLRRRAEKRLKTHPVQADLPRTETDTLRLLHELQVHQVELKMQNEELQQARDTLELQVQKQTAELSQTVRQLEERSAQLRTAAMELTLAEQRERQRLAMLLHDEQQQFLVSAKLHARLLERTENPDVQQACREITALLDEAIKHTRSLVWELSPPILPMRGLLPALEWLAGWMKEYHHFTVVVRAVHARSGESVVLGDQELTILFFRAVRELLFNTLKHAKVPLAQVEIDRRDGGVQVIVSDAGVGFAPTALRVERGLGGGFGLFSIRQRLELLGGRLQIDSTPGRGSRITLWAPLLGSETTALPGQSDTPGSTGLERLPPPLSLPFGAGRARFASLWWTIRGSCDRAWCSC